MSSNNDEGLDYENNSITIFVREWPVFLFYWHMGVNGFGSVNIYHIGIK